MATKTTRVALAGVLIGGHSRRMGVPKTQLIGIDGRPILDHVIRIARQVVSEVVLLGRPPAALQTVPELDVLDDDPAGGGPLAGLCALLARTGQRPALLLACDMPRLTVDVLGQLLAHATTLDDVVLYARLDDPVQRHTCCALYHPRILDQARAALEAGRAGLHALIARLERVRVLESDHTIETALTNVNTPEDLARCGLPAPPAPA